MKQYITAAILLLATLTCACTAAGATQLYVNETGWWIDPAQFNSSSTPIQSAINNATDSDLIYVHNGSYNENVNVNKRLTLVGEGREVVTVTASSAYSNIFYVNRDYVNISGFTVTGVTGSGSGIYLSHADHCNISDNNASGNYYGIYLSSSSNNNITNNRANSNNRNGICISYSNSNTVCKNTVGLNMHTGILLISSSCYNDLYDNTIHNNSNGFWFYEPSCDHNRIHGNRVFDHIGDHGSITSQNRHAIRLYDASCNQVYNNTVYSNYNSISIWSRSDYNEVFDNNVTNNTVGITVSGHTDHFCRYNDIHDNHVELSRASGIEVISLDGYNSIYNNTLHANDRSGIRLENHAAVDFVYNNTIDSSGWYGIEVSWNNNSDIHDNTLFNNSRWDIYIYQNSFNNTFVNNTLLSDHPTTISFTYSGKVSLKGVDLPPSDPDGWLNISRFVNATIQDSGAWMQLNVSYNDSDVAGDESTLLMWKHDAGWGLASPDTGVNTIENYVYANITDACRGIFTPLVNDGGTIPAPTVHNINTSEDFFTIQEAIDATNTSDGHTIEVGDGIYSENVEVIKRLTIRSENGSANCIVNGSSGGYDPVFRVAVDDVSIIGLTIERDGTYNGIKQDHDVNNTLVKDNVIRKISHGISLHRTCGSSILDNTIENATYTSIYIYESTDTCIDNNRMLSPSTTPSYHIYMFGGENITIANNTAFSASYCGIYLSDSDNNTLVCNTVNESDQYGIYLHLSSNNTLINNTANSNKWYGFYLLYSSNNTLTNNTVNSTELYIGIYVHHSDNNTLIRNTANYNGWEGIRLEDSDNCLVDGNNLSYNNITEVGTGLLSWASNNAILTNNTVRHNAYGIYLHITSSNNTVINNTASENEVHGITVYQSSNAMIYNNTANNNGYHGIFLCDSPTENITICNNTVSHNIYNGIFSTLYYTTAAPSNLTITGNTLIDNGVGDNHGYGIYLKESSGTIISDNYITDNAALSYAYGIKLKSFTNATIHNNTIVNNSDYGIMLDSVSGCSTMMGFACATEADIGGMPSTESEENNIPPTTLALLDDDYSSGMFQTRRLLAMDIPGGINVTDNRIINNTGGIWVNTSSGVVVAGNTVTDNDVGINLTSSSNNTIYNNYFDNTNNAADDGVNIWNTTNTTGPNIIGGLYIGGNHWSDYAGTDGDGDGFGDAAHDISGGSNHDYLPLVRGMCGDVDCSGVVNILDVRLLMNHVADPTGYPVALCAGNVDGSGGIDMADVQLLVAHVFDPAGHSLKCPT